MKLSAQQIAKIEETLVLNGIQYDDIKLEVLDHIASEIEALQEVNSLSFDENFKTAFQQRIITVPNYLVVGLKPINDFDDSLLVVDNEVINHFYIESTGYIRTQTNTIQTAIVTLTALAANPAIINNPESKQQLITLLQQVVQDGNWLNGLLMMNQLLICLELSLDVMEIMQLNLI
mgnify:CR=1 FL=1